MTALMDPQSAFPTEDAELEAQEARDHAQQQPSVPSGCPGCHAFMFNGEVRVRLCRDCDAYERFAAEEAYLAKRYPVVEVAPVETGLNHRCTVCGVPSMPGLLCPHCESRP